MSASTVKTIFLADDDEDDRMLIKEAVQQVIPGVQVVEVEDGTGLLNILRSGQTALPYIIVMDMNMPCMNGLETLREVRTICSLQEAPAVMMSTTLNNDLTLQAYEEGVNIFLAKPITEKEFIRMAHIIDLCFLQRYPEPNRWTKNDVAYAQEVVIVHEHAHFDQTVRSTLRKRMVHDHVREFFNPEDAIRFFESYPSGGTNRHPDLIIFLPEANAPGQSPNLVELKRLLVKNKMTSSVFIECAQRNVAHHILEKPIQQQKRFA